MVSLTREEVQEAYGIDLTALRQACPGALIGIVSPDGAIWRGDPTRHPLLDEDRLVDIVRSRGAGECLILHSAGESRQLLERQCSGCRPEVTPYWIPTPHGTFCLLFGVPEATEA